MFSEKTLNKILKIFDKKALSSTEVKWLYNEHHAAETMRRDLLLLSKQTPELAHKALQALPKSRSQLRQDIFALCELEFKEGGFFVEFGATNGVDLSNSFLLETEFNWPGILAEPARSWHSDLKANRKAKIETRCVWRASGERLTFNEVPRSKELSTIDAFSSSDGHAKRRAKGTRYEVETISLNDLLDAHDAPAIVDYLSIDTEGSEYEILSNFDFSKRQFRVITCEHNYTPERDKIHALLTGNGYMRKFEDVSHFDDWYVKV